MTEEESDSAKLTMAEASNLAEKAMDILITKESHEGLELTVKHLFTRQETEEHKSAKALFDFCVFKLEIHLIIKLLKVYISSSNGVIRFQSLHLLSETIIKLRNRNFELSLDALNVIKPLLISCLTMEETKESDVRIFRNVVSFVAYEIVRLVDNKGWDELSDCILSLADKEPVKAFHVVIDLPLVYGRFVSKFMERVTEKAEKVLLKLSPKAKDWCLALQTMAKIGVLVSDTETRSRLIKVVVESVNKLVEKGLLKKGIVERGLEDLKKFLARDAKLSKYSKDRVFYVGKLAFEIAASYRTIEQGKNVAREVIDIVKRPEKYKLDVDDRRARFDRDWYAHLKNLSTLEVLRIFASTDLEVRSRELAIRRLNVVLSDHTAYTLGGSPPDHTSSRSEHQPLLISCLNEKRLSESMFKVLGEVVDHVRYDMYLWKDATWYGLRDHLASRNGTEFKRVVYVFQCLNVHSEEETEFVIPIMESLLPEIKIKLTTQTEFLADVSSWVLAFTGAFCAVVRLIEYYADEVKEIAYNMIFSVEEIVGRGKEVGLVMRAFRDVESLVKKQWEGYGTCEYKFVKGMLWRLYGIKGMRWESKIVLWRINVILETSVDEETKELPKSEFDWINSEG
ncbi:unnamed protein product [Cochlearia groenlandica]